MGASWWPLFLIIGSNLVYQSCSRCASREVQPLAALTIVYAIATMASFLLFLILGRGGMTFMASLRALNWANYLLGLAIIGLEGGFLCLYRAGWSVSVGPICTYCGVAIGLLVLGALCFHEHITLRQVVGTLLCLGGIAMIS